MAGKNPIEITDVIGPRGPYQILVGIILALACALTGAQFSYIQYLAPKVQTYWNWESDWSNRTTFYSDNCKMEDIIYFNQSSLNSSSSAVLIYESKYMDKTITEKFNLICENSWLVSFTKSLCAISVAVGVLFTGQLTQRYGRKRSISIMIVFASASNLCLLFSLNYTMFAVSYFIISWSTFYLFLTMVTLFTEILASSNRQLVSIVLQGGWIVGLLIPCGAAWISRDWFYTQLAPIIMLALLIPLIWCLEESPTWLMVKGNRDEAKRVAIIITKRNGRNVQDIVEDKVELWLQSLQDHLDAQITEDKGHLTELFKNRIITRYTCCLTIALSSNSFCSNSIMMNIEEFGCGLYVDTLICQAVAAVSATLIIILGKRISSKWIQITWLLLFGTLCGLYTFLYEIPLCRTVLSMAGRGIISPINILTTTYTAEVFPTSVRVVGQAFVSSVGRVLGIVAPFAKELGESTFVYVPFIFFSALGFLSAFLFTFLPNTRNKPLTHTVQDLLK